MQTPLLSLIPGTLGSPLRYNARVLTLPASILLSLLPLRWRRRWNATYELELSRGALFSGLLVFAGCLILLIVRYLFFLDARMKAVAATMIAHGAEEAMGNRYFQYGAGIVTLIEYLIHPLSLLLIYFLFEGLVRFCAAFINGEVVGTMPLHLVALAHERWSRAAAERALGPRIPDEVQTGATRLQVRILSCRPKPAWDRLITVSYEGGLYEVAGTEQGPPPRPYIYLLRPKPEHKVVRGLHHYDPNEVMTEDRGTSARR